ncbi:MAG: 5-(carboxyamino)imidazole ribonucleotide mutase [Alphaproteobacteria bacterium]|nr:5-(carboxyamino)imidazole ribonucleotide mutase [Alphaproteobacteria bacterium]
MSNKIQAAIIMGSQSDWEIMKNAAMVLEEFNIPHEAKVISAHRRLPYLTQYVQEASNRGVKVFITGAGVAAALPGVVAAMTPLPVLGVPLPGKFLDGLDALLSIVQMPAGIPVGTLAVGTAGAKNAALLAVSIIGVSDPSLHKKIADWREAQVAKLSDTPKD